MNEARPFERKPLVLVPLVSSLIGALALALVSACTRSIAAPPAAPETAAAAQTHATCTRTAERDDDSDGISDEEEDLLAARFAPIVILDPADQNRPASLSWFFDRVARPKAGDTTLSVPRAARGGSRSPADWTTYVHVYPSQAEPCSVHLQYWFFYPYNTAPVLFDHDGDWEHVTITVDEQRNPKAVFLARHNDDRPGVLRPWARLRRVGDHPIVLSARGSHATYAELHELPLYERAFSCADVDHCAAPVWRTWQGGGLANVGERSRPSRGEQELTYAGHWGRVGLIPGTSAPRGPLHHRGFCIDAFAECRAAIGVR